ncbi:MAG: hypothetical protein RL213_1545 [Bacteroidota bacterium]|jgi:glycosyltransferase involved in cell wall biosynthesis
MDLRGKKAIVAVISDLVTDQRVHRTCVALRGEGAVVTLVGRKLPGSLSPGSRAYRTVRFRLPFTKGPLMYAAFNIRLFLYLLFRHFDFLVANDLDTLPAAYLASRLKRKPLLYDSHEFFTEVPELVGRPRVQRIWRGIERRIFPSLKSVMTVNGSIAQLYTERYGNHVHIVRNIPLSDTFGEQDVYLTRSRSDFSLPEDRTIFLLQGAGINVHRGAEEAVEAMLQVDKGLLLIVGGGDVLEQLKKTVTKLRLDDKVMFLPKMPPAALRKLTRLADFGLTLDKDTNLNYRFSLPNKLFDYIHAGIPVIASDLPEIRRIVEGYGIGTILPAVDPRTLAETMNRLCAGGPAVQEWKRNLQKASAELTWENERAHLLQAVKDAF